MDTKTALDAEAERAEAPSATTSDRDEGFTAKHKGIWQLIKFTLFSSIAGLTEGITNLLLDTLILKSLNDIPVDRWIFHYDGDGVTGLGTMIAFLLSALIGNTVAFITNRRATFNANNNAAASGAMYFTAVAILICVQTWLGPIVKDALIDLLPLTGAASNTVCNLLAKTAMTFGMFLILFPLNKYVIMRRTEKNEK